MEDEFAQTRGSDDLFDDDFTPISPPADEPQSEPAPAPETSTTTAAPESTRPSQPQNEAPQAPQAPKAQAVRGDRSGTGGVKKPKLTEEELSARMAAAKINAQKRSEAHKRAEADEASFQEREKVAAQKRRVDAQNRRVMDGEREKNRQRKLNAQGGREWDEQKNPEDFTATRGGRGQYRRGAHGGVQYDGGRTNGRAGDEDNEGQQDDEGNQRDGYRGRGRGRGRGGGRGRGRGEFNHSQGGRGGSRQNHANNSQTPQVGVESEFPALPPGTKAVAPDDTNGGKKDLPKATETPQVPAETPQPPALDIGSWADQVQESSGTPTKEQPVS